MELSGQRYGAFAQRCDRRARAELFTTEWPEGFFGACPNVDESEEVANSPPESSAVIRSERFAARCRCYLVGNGAGQLLIKDNNAVY